MPSPRIEFGRVEGDWSDKEVYVIGGGPSLKDFDFTRLKGYTIGANRTAFVANTDALVSVDRVFITRAAEDMKGYAGRLFLCVKNPDGCIPLEGATYLRYDPSEGLSDNPEYLIGLNSGHCALNVAYLLNAKSISLLGFDMKMDGSTKHFHGGYSWAGGAGNYMPWAKRFGRAATQLKNKGVQVINYVGPNGSGLTCFPTRPLEELQ
ncbi:MAG TPA: hypothetical protein V6D20_25375 [Candidatus Obscuribacterales bacterium]